MIPRKKAGAIATTIAIITLTTFTAISFVAFPLLALLVGMLIGCVLEWFTGDYVVQAFNAIGLASVKDGDLPKVFGLLAVVASILKIGGGNALQQRQRKGDD